MAMGGVFTQTDVTNDDQLWALPFDSARGLLHDSIVRPSPSRHLILRFRQSKKGDCRNAKRPRLAGFLYGFIEGKIEHPRHGAHFLPLASARADKQGINESFRTQPSLAHQGALLLALAEAAKAGGRKRHIGKTHTGLTLILANRI